MLNKLYALYLVVVLRRRYFFQWANGTPSSLRLYECFLFTFDGCVGVWYDRRFVTYYLQCVNHHHDRKGT